MYACMSLQQWVLSIYIHIYLYTQTVHKHIFCWFHSQPVPMYWESLASEVSWISGLLIPFFSPHTLSIFWRTQSLMKYYEILQNMTFIPRLNTPLGSWAKKDSCRFYFFPFRCVSNWRVFYKTWRICGFGGFLVDTQLWDIEPSGEVRRKTVFRRVQQKRPWKLQGVEGSFPVIFPKWLWDFFRLFYV